MRKLLIAFVIVLAGILLAPILVLASFFGDSESSDSGSNFCAAESGALPSRVPQPMNKIFTAAAKYYGVPPYAVALVYFVENRGYRDPPPPYGNGPPYASSNMNAMGPMQFIPPTWWIYRNSNPINRPGNVMDLVDAAYGTARMLADNGAKGNPPFGSSTKMYDRETIVFVLASYNAGGPSNFNNSQTREYVWLAEKEYLAYFQGSKVSPSQQDDGCKQSKSDSAVKNASDEAKSLCQGRTTRVGSVTTARGDKITLCEENGIVVNATISERFSLLVELVGKAGYTIAGSGFRTGDSQIALRIAHCGSSDYAIYQMDSMSCKPPTAKPGTSAHERGMAVDLSGYAYGNGIFNATQKAASDPRVGFVNNVPTEPWHWAAR